MPSSLQVGELATGDFISRPDLPLMLHFPDRPNRDSGLFTIRYGALFWGLAHTQRRFLDGNFEIREPKRGIAGAFRRITKGRQDR